MKKKRIHKKPFLIIFVGAALLVVAILASIGILLDTMTLRNESSTAPGQGLISIKGVVLCLPHKDTSGPQTLECAFGLKDENGRYYGLKDSDPGYKNVGNLPMNEPVEVTGSLKKETSTTYPTVGTIEVTKITRN
jgi:hypothetical protein